MIYRSPCPPDFLELAGAVDQETYVTGSNLITRDVFWVLVPLGQELAAAGQDRAVIVASEPQT